MSDGPRHEDLEDLYENAPCGYLSLGADGRIVKSNRTFTVWTGHPAEALIGKRLRELLNVAGRIFYETHFAPLLRMQGFFDEVALDIVTADKQVLQVLANASEKRDEDGKLIFTRLTIFRAGERRRYERDLVNAQEAERAAREKLEEVNGTLQDMVAEQQAARTQEKEYSELREQFIAVLGHDLRNPLAAIGAGTGMLLKEGWTERSPKILQLMNTSVSRMSGLVDNVMDLARTRLGGGLGLQLEPGRPLEPTLVQVIDEMRATWPDRSFHSQLHIVEDIDVDHVRMAQLLSNLLGNAITHGAEDKPIQINAVSADGRFELTVANSGAEIPAELKANLFKPFHRGEVRPSLQGLGLGLYITEQIALAHGGTVEVESNEVETRFTVRIQRRA